MAEQDDDSAYGRVSTPERYVVLHHAATQIVAELRERYDVAVTEVAPEGPNAAGGLLSAMKLTPSDGNPSLTFTWSGFPGVFVAGVDQRARAFPACGCDACDEDPDYLVEDMRDEVQGATTAWPLRER